MMGITSGYAADHTIAGVITLQRCGQKRKKASTYVEAFLIYHIKLLIFP